MSIKDDRAARSLLKKTLFASAYGAKPDTILQSLGQAIVNMNEYAKIGKDVYEGFIEAMKQQWIIEDHWSNYHSMVAQGQGWGLSYSANMWQVVSLNEAKFATDEAARLYVLEHEHDQDSSLYAIAVQAVIVGNMR